MEAKRESDVWQRVAAPPSLGGSREDLGNLLQSAGERAVLFHTLAGSTPKAKEQIRQLRELEQANIACLRGMLAFSNREFRIPSRKAPPGPLRQNLIRGYYLAKKAAAEYTARSVDPEFGVVYQEMAGREGKICAIVTQLLGEIS